MPNWCVGIMKVRGTSENLIRFFRECIYYSQDKKAPVIHENEGILDYVNVKKSGYIAIKGVTRNEIQSTDSFGEIYFTDYKGEDGIKVGYFRFETAWGIEADQLVEVSKNYGIDIRIHAFEQGMEFEQFIEVHAGNLIKDEIISFEGRCWAWECVNPNWGG